MKELTLTSGKKLEINDAPFAEAQELFEAVLEELRGIPMDGSAEMDANFYKDIFCTGFYSKKIKAALWKCMNRCLYDGVKVVPATFEPVEARADYLSVCYEVMAENLSHFYEKTSMHS